MISGLAVSFDNRLLSFNTDRSSAGFFVLGIFLRDDVYDR